MTASHHKDSHDEHADGIVEDRRQPPPVYFNLLFYGLILWGLVFCAYYLLSGWSSEGEFEQKMAAYTQAHAPESPAQAPDAEEQAAAGEAGGINAAAIYTTNCAGCHGSGGSGGFATDLTGDYTYGRDVDSIRTSITDGRGDMMPAFAGNLSPEEIDALANYLLTL